MRNLLLNWLVIIPAIAVLLLILKITITISVAVARIDAVWWPHLVSLLLGIACLIVAQAYTTSHRPTRRLLPGEDPGHDSKNLDQWAYLRGDLSFFNRRLKFVGGLRGEQTNVKAEGPLTDTTRNYQRDASGRVILANGNPVLIVPTSDALGVSRRTFLDRGQKTNKEYLRLFPSLNASYTVRDNLVARGAYYQSIGRPDFNQYGGSVTLPNTENPPGPNNQISINNAGIKAWSARTTKLALEYYFEPVGLVSVSAFQRG